VRRSRGIPSLVLVIALTMSGAGEAATSMCTAHSPAHRVALVELYSSEGCSSCPPADRWLGQWKDGSTSNGVVPLELHVDYWNSLGWTDRFSQHRFTERQQSLTDRAGGHVIYTPEVFVSGRELRSWSRPERFDTRVQNVMSEPAQADVAIELAPLTQGIQGIQGTAGGLDIDARFTAHATARDTLNAYVAVYENDLTSQVRAGENSGATLHHDRVVRQWIGPVPLVAGSARIHQDVAVSNEDDKAIANGNVPVSRFGVVAFVENASTGDVLQVADLAACR
jgi:hypothetical protein